MKSIMFYCFVVQNKKQKIKQENSHNLNTHFLTTQEIKNNRCLTKIGFSSNPFTLRHCISFIIINKKTQGAVIRLHLHCLKRDIISNRNANKLCCDACRENDRFLLSKKVNYKNLYFCHKYQSIHHIPHFPSNYKMTKWMTFYI